MPSVDYDELRRIVPLETALNLIDFQETRRRTQGGEQLRGRCPLPGCDSADGFAANLRVGRWYCHKCKASGRVLDLWQCHRQMRLFDASIDLCEVLLIPVPLLERVRTNHVRMT